MTFDVALPRIGELRVGDVRAAVKAGAKRVDVLVLSAEGEAPFFGRVEIGTKRSGKRLHAALLCPECNGPRRVLYRTSRGLGCAGCSRHRTRAQREWTMSDWRRGGREEDGLLRTLTRPGRSEAAMVTACTFVEELLRGDADRYAALRRATDALRLLDGAPPSSSLDPCILADSEQAGEAR